MSYEEPAWTTRLASAALGEMICGEDGLSPFAQCERIQSEIAEETFARDAPENGRQQIVAEGLVGCVSDRVRTAFASTKSDRGAITKN